MDTEKNSPSKENLLILRGNGRKPKRNLLRKPPSSWTDLHAIDGVSTKVEYALGTNLRSTNQILSTVICSVEVETADYMKYLDIGCLTCTERAGRLS